LSGNNLTYLPLTSFLSPAIEIIKLNNITNGQAANIFDFSSNVLTNLKEISLERNNLCGPFPKSWKENGLNVNLKGHSKTLWCSPSLNSDACGI
jgi:hypothetical protein